jgi:hypothetical protein
MDKEQNSPESSQSARLTCCVRWWFGDVKMVFNFDCWESYYRIHLKPIFGNRKNFYRWQAEMQWNEFRYMLIRLGSRDSKLLGKLQQRQYLDKGEEE